MPETTLYQDVVAYRQRVRDLAAELDAIVERADRIEGADNVASLLLDAGRTLDGTIRTLGYASTRAPGKRPR
jgi:hypothetical protein